MPEAFSRAYTPLQPAGAPSWTLAGVVPSTRSRVVWIAAAALLLGVLWVIVPRLLARLFYDDVVWAVNGWFVQYDLTIFLRAGDAVLDGVSPYPAVSELRDDTSYVYPPLLALLMAPLALLPSGLAASIFTFGGILALVGAPSSSASATRAAM